MVFSYYLVWDQRFSLLVVADFRLEKIDIAVKRRELGLPIRTLRLTISFFLMQLTISFFLMQLQLTFTKDLIRFLDRIFFGDYPSELRQILSPTLPPFTSEEENFSKAKLAFIGFNQYTTTYANFFYLFFMPNRQL